MLCICYPKTKKNRIIKINIMLCQCVLFKKIKYRSNFAAYAAHSPEKKTLLKIFVCSSTQFFHKYL